MNKKKTLILLLLITAILVFNATHSFAQTPDDWDNPDPGGDLPIPGILYFMAALIGIGVKKLYYGRKKD